MRSVKILIAPVLALAAAGAWIAAPAQAATWESCDQWGNTELDGYTLYNNIWGSGAGSQCISAESAADWSVKADHPNTGGIKSYPNAKKVVNKPLSELKSLSSKYDVTVPDSGAYNTSYDIWDTDHDYEIMLWTNYTGAVGPIGTPEGKVTLGGHSWDVYKGSNGANEVFSFLRTSDSSAGEVDILPILKWIEEKGWWSGETIGDVQFGYEITSSAGGLDFRTNDISVSSS
ncbi:glycoside hydrolase family 12 protein [Streptomyces boninensis]|uniref:glycoside hydrolase family 12 protein n=1 Tax=Streptomyces boninensis TaxID=2039455 RepID=UPI003B22443A